jgi:hypothetical protein
VVALTWGDRAAVVCDMRAHDPPRPPATQGSTVVIDTSAGNRCEALRRHCDVHLQRAVDSVDGAPDYQVGSHARTAVRGACEHRETDGGTGPGKDVHTIRNLSRSERGGEGGGGGVQLRIDYHPPESQSHIGPPPPLPDTVAVHTAGAAEQGCARGFGGG